MDKNFKLFIKLINNEEYYEAHEVLEEVWFPNRKKSDPDTFLLKGFINASVSFELLKRGKKDQAIKVWKNYEKYIVYLDSCSPNNLKIFKDIKLILEKKYEQLLS